MTETEKLERFIDAERQKGLVHIDFFVADVSRSTIESFSAEVNQMLAAPEVPDTELI